MWYVVFFFFNDTATTEIYTLSLHDALPISRGAPCCSRVGRRLRRRRGRFPCRIGRRRGRLVPRRGRCRGRRRRDRKSTRLNSSHANISYAVFCLKKKKLSIPRFHPGSLSSH